MIAPPGLRVHYREAGNLNPYLKQDLLLKQEETPHNEK